MKRLIFILLLIPVMAFTDHKPKQFTVTFSVTYNAITLERAAELEQAFRTLYKDACKIDVDVKKVSVDIGWTNLVVDTIMTEGAFYWRSGGGWTELNDSLEVK